MGRRSGVVTFIRAMERASRQAQAEQRRQEREQIRMAREVTRLARETDRQRIQDDREAKRQHLEDRAAEVVRKNEELEGHLEELGRLLDDGLEHSPWLTFESLKKSTVFNDLVLPRHLHRAPVPPDRTDFSVPPPNWLAKLLPGTAEKHAKRLTVADSEFAEATHEHAIKLSEHEAEVQKHKDEHEAKRAAHVEQVNQHNAEVDEFTAKYRGGDPESVASYCTLVLEASRYPDEFPQEFRVAYTPESKQLVCEYELPKPDVVPRVGEFKFIRSRDEIEEKPRKASDLKERYSDVVASVTLRTVHELFQADVARQIDVLVFNGFVDRVDPASGKDVRPCLISVRVTRPQFEQLHLARVDKGVCLRNLGALVSPRADEAQAVKPIIEFNMVDKRFVQESDVLSDLESRPNLMDLNPFEFENLVANLFGKMGLETRLTRSSKDGGVDAVAFDPRPVLGGKVVIQAKRYKNTVGVSAVRDLYGTMLNEGASKGILVTTSGYGPDAFEFAKDKPIELLDGGRLLYLLQEVGVQARIVFPAEA
jgi:restriction system protein